MNMFSYPTHVQQGLRHTLWADALAGFDALEDCAVQAHLIACETADFHWDARIQERYLDEFESEDDENNTLYRTAILGFLQGRWFLAIAIIDGDGDVCDLKSLRHFDDIRSANRAFSGVG